jgi:hypothetical protein
MQLDHHAAPSMDCGSADQGHGDMIELDVLMEGQRLIARASAAGVAIRLIGGVAIRLHHSSEPPAALHRSFPDIDFVTPAGSSSAATRVFREAGYAPNISFNALHGQERLIFYDAQHHRQVDVFVGVFRMCHTIPVAERLDRDPYTIPLAELLLTKLQVVELNEKDVKDALLVLHGHRVDAGDSDTVNGQRIAELCAANWGLWRTVTANLRTCRMHLAGVDLPDADKAVISARLDALAARIESEPKSRIWKLRARVGDRLRWYELPEEIARAAVPSAVPTRAQRQNGPTG